MLCLDGGGKNGSIPAGPCSWAMRVFRCSKRLDRGQLALIEGIWRIMAKRTFPIVLVKPSHYDEDGYVIQWWRSTIPSNSLATIYGLLAVCAEEPAPGPASEMKIDSYDESNT